MDKITQNTKWGQAKSDKTQRETNLELEPLLFISIEKKKKEASKVETLVVLNLNF
jgi:hypothetical protein